jgi:polyisoprenyl-phosphate glycosyltransferase
MPTPQLKLAILIPVFNDWPSFRLLMTNLDEALSRHQLSVEVVAIDDGSSISPRSFNFGFGQFAAVEKISVVELTRNLGHQRAIAIGLAYIEANIACLGVLVMDSDGEDDVEDVPRLLQRCQEAEWRKIVFARRAKRNEGRAFQALYWLYKKMFRLLTGQSIGVGNFSIIPCSILRRLVSVSEIWNHYAVGVMKAKIPLVEIITNRGKRLAGKSRMDFASLVVHGLSAISVFGDVTGVRLLISTLLLMTLAILGIGVTFFIRLSTTLAIPGWATYLSTTLAVIALQSFILALGFIFLILNTRNSVGFVPSRDYIPFILSEQTIYPSVQTNSVQAPVEAATRA